MPDEVQVFGLVLLSRFSAVQVISLIDQEIVMALITQPGDQRGTSRRNGSMRGSAFGLCVGRR